MWLIFEGLDKSGKTTLEWSFLKATNYKINVVDRGPIGYMIFDKLFNRSTLEGNKEFIYQANKINNSNDFFVVYCMTKPEIALKRIKENNEECPYDYSEAQFLMNCTIWNYYNNDHCLVINTTSKSIDECTQEIVNWLKNKGVLK